MGDPVIETRQKRWGVEEFLFSGAYLVKRLVLLDGMSTSMHFHYAKCETIIAVEGRLLIEFLDPDTGERRDVVLTPGEWCTIREGRRNAHKMTAMPGHGNVAYVECSTPHHFDSERIETDER